jgi:hypothetical protein
MFRNSLNNDWQGNVNWLGMESALTWLWNEFEGYQAKSRQGTIDVEKIMREVGDLCHIKASGSTCKRGWQSCSPEDTMTHWENLLYLIDKVEKILRECWRWVTDGIAQKKVFWLKQAWNTEKKWSEKDFTKSFLFSLLCQMDWCFPLFF